MNNQEFLNQIKNSQEKGLELIHKKNADYAGEKKPFKNFDTVEYICGISSEKGILVRMCDKLVRIENLLNTKAKVKDESIEDTLLDLANYSYILLVKIKSRK